MLPIRPDLMRRFLHPGTRLSSTFDWHSPHVDAAGLLRAIGLGPFDHLVGDPSAEP